MGSLQSNADDLAIFYEKTMLAGLAVNATAYGIIFTVAWSCLCLLWKEKRKTRRTYFFIAYTCLGLILSTVLVTTTSITTQRVFILGQNYPGGPAAFSIQETLTLPSEIAANLATVLVFWLCDTLLLLRGVIFYQGTKWVWVMILPGLMFLAFTAASIRFLILTTAKNISLLSAADFILPAVVLSQSLNILVSILIIIRLLIHRRNIARTLGTTHSNQYLSLIAMIVESACLSSSFGITFLILCGLKHPVEGTFMQALEQVQVISPLLIVHRVAQRRAWSAETSSTLIGNGSSWYRAARRGNSGIHIHLSRSKTETADAGVHKNEEILMPGITRTLQFASDKGETIIKNSSPGASSYIVDDMDLRAREEEKRDFGNPKPEVSGYQNERCTEDSMV